MDVLWIVIRSKSWKYTDKHIPSGTLQEMWTSSVL